MAAANATHCHADEPGTAGFSGWHCSFEYLMQCVMHDFVFCFLIIFGGSVKHYKFSAKSCFCNLCTKNFTWPLVYCLKCLSLHYLVSKILNNS